MFFLAAGAGRQYSLDSVSSMSAQHGRGGRDVSDDGVTLEQVLKAVQNGNRNIRDHLRRQDQILEEIAESQKKLAEVASDHGDRISRLEDDRVAI